MTNLEVVQKICEWRGITDYVNHINFVENRLGQDYRYSISSKKLRQELDWQPEQEKLFNFTK
jgi:dTDP-D-glucose 4,6-dehydratase